MKIYLAGPMAGMPDHNFPAFHAKARELRAKGHEVYNPAELEPESYRNICEEEAAKHHHTRAFKGKRVITEHSSLKKRMRVGEFKEVKMTPARKREFWHAAMRQRWNDIRNLATDLEKDRERRRMMRLAV